MTDAELKAIRERCTEHRQVKTYACALIVRRPDIYGPLPEAFVCVVEGENEEEAKSRAVEEAHRQRSKKMGYYEEIYEDISHYMEICELPANTADITALLAEVERLRLALIDAHQDEGYP